jgi:hypothetical protein
MAITTTSIGINTGNVSTWTGIDVINQFEQAFSWLGWHGDTKTGLCVGISTISGGGTISGSSVIYEDVEPISTTGIGTGASFLVRRSNIVNEIYVNRPGYGYTGGETLVLPAASIGGSSNGATNLTLKVIVDGTIANGVGYAITFTGLYSASGTDRNGVVSGANTTITIKEGDTLTFTNNQSSTNYRINILWRAIETTDATDSNRVFNVSGQENSNTAGGQTTWTPLPGQAGTYYVNSSFSGGSYAPFTPTIIVLPASSGDITYTGAGSTTSFYSKKTLNGNDFGVLRHTIQSGKKYGDTYRSIHLRHNDVNNLYITSGSAYFPFFRSTDARYGGGHAYGDRFSGTRLLDAPDRYIVDDNRCYQGDTNFYTSSPNNRAGAYSLITGGNTQYQLDLNIFRSSLDPKFAVFSFKAPSKPSTHISGNTYATFIFHNFTTDIWDLDDVFLGGWTEIFANGDGSITNPYISFRSQLVGSHDPRSNNFTSYNPAKRTAEFGYAPIDSDDSDGIFVDTSTIAFADYYSITYPNGFVGAGNRIYYRNSNIPVRTNGGANSNGSSNSNGRFGNSSISSDANFNAVVKGIPLNSCFVPSPYYIPDDFVLIDFDYGVPSANIQQGDTITISGSEVYTVINGSYNNTNVSRTRGILFCARTV